MTALLFTLALLVPALLADSLPGTGANQPAAQGVTTSQANYEGYFQDPGLGYTNPLDAPDFGQLGLGPTTFLFAPNTMYGFQGIATFSLLSANGDPMKGFISLNDPTTKLMSFTIPGGSSQSLPEPRSVYLALLGLALLSASVFHRARAR